MKSALYSVNNSSQTIAVNDIISFGSIVRRFGCINMSNGNVVLSGSGYYDLEANITFAGTAGTTTITLYKDGVVIPGASASLTTEAGSVYSVTIPAMIRETCPCESTITAIVSGVAATVSNAAIRVEKL